MAANNTTANGLSGYHFPKSAELLLLCRNCLGILLSLAIIVGNSMVIACVVKFPWLRCPANYLVTSLSTSDLFVGLVFLPLLIFSQMAPGLRPDCLCSFVVHVEPPLCFLAILHLLAINIERLLCIQFPLRYHSWMTSRMTALMVAMPWILAASDTTLAYLTIHITYSPHCILYPPGEIPSIIAAFIFFTPFMIICVIYARIWKIVRRHFLFANEQAHTAKCHNTSRCNCLVAVPSRSFHTKVVRTVAAVLGTFTLSWGSYLATTLSYGYVGDETKETLVFYVLPVVEILVFAKSAVDPWIYAFWCPQFKKAFSQLTRRVDNRRGLMTFHYTPSKSTTLETKHVQSKLVI